MTKGKVVLVPFPFDDLTTSKVRPAVCLTDPIGPYRHIILAFVTSRVPAEVLETDLVFYSEHAGFSATGLRATSTLQMHRLMTVTTTMIQRELGALPPDLQREADDRLKKLFKLAG